jgi:hypothetical protein
VKAGDLHGLARMCLGERDRVCELGPVRRRGKSWLLVHVKWNHTRFHLERQPQNDHPLMTLGFVAVQETEAYLLYHVGIKKNRLVTMVDELNVPALH